MSKPLNRRCWILHTLWVLCFTTNVISVAFSTNQLAMAKLPFFNPIQSLLVRYFPISSISLLTWHSRCDPLGSCKQQKDTPTYFQRNRQPSAVARITLLRARGAGRIRFFRIGTRVLYSDEQLLEFLASCQVNHKPHHPPLSKSS
jgi:hypothetical protein